MASSSSQTVRDKTKRRTAPLSCAECRRLKLRCSRVFPCTSCVKKGCAAICPDGSLTTGKGNRFVLANTEVLHDKITLLAGRVRELEDALQEAHADRSKDTHPLLAPELLQIKRPLERESSDPPKEVEVDPAEAIDVGSLSISESGHTNFFGTTANAWYLLQNQEGGDDDTEDGQISLPPDLLNHAFPFSVSSPEAVLNLKASLLDCLPDMQEARRVAELYYRHAAWMYTPVPESEFYGTMLPRVYNQTLTGDQDPIDSHRLAVVFLVLALGTLLDLDLPALSTQSMQYYQLGRTALSLDSILECQSIPAIQALLLMCHFMFFSFIDGPRWALMGLAVKLAQSVGLHRDSGRWNLAPDETFKRRSLLWELFTYDAWQCLTFGRPPSFFMPYIDCQMAHETTKTEQGETEMSFHAWKHRFSSRCLSVVQEVAFGARPASYKAIQDLDKKVRSFYTPPSLCVPGFGGAKMPDIGAPPPSVELTMQRYTAFSIREITIFYLHRGFFAKAIEDHPEDPLGSKYAPSFLAAYNSACSFAGLIRSLYSQYPGLTERLWFLFTHVFSCAIVLGSIPTRCPTMALARSALSHLDSACGLFEDASRNARAAKVLPVLRKLKARAMLAMADQQTRLSPVNRLSPEGSSGKEDEEFAALGGGTRLVARKSPSVPSSPQGVVPPVETPLMHHAPMVPSSSHESPPQNGGDNGHSQHSQSPPTSWTGYPQHHQSQQPQPPPQQQQPAELYEFSGYHNMVPEIPEQWHDTPGYAHAMDPTAMIMDTMPVHYGMYGHQVPMGGHGYAPVQSPVDSPVHVRGNHADPDASWRNLFAQFNQA